jgi:hypothetical protein
LSNQELHRRHDYFEVARRLAPGTRMRTTTIAFIEVDRWRGATPLMVFGPADAASSTFGWRVPTLGAHARSVQRATAAILALGVTWVVVGALTLRVDAASDVAPAHRIDTLQLVEIDRTPPGDRPTLAPAAVGGGAAQPAAVAMASPIDTSTPTPLSLTEWSVTRIAARPTAVATVARSAGPAVEPGEGNAQGDGGSGVYDPYAGASPARRSEAADDEIDQTALAELTASLRRRYPQWHGQLLCTVNAAPAGDVVQSQCLRVSGNIEPHAVEQAMAGMRLFEMGAGDRTSVVDVDM